MMALLCAPGLLGCDESASKSKVGDPSLYEPPIIHGEHPGGRAASGSEASSSEASSSEGSAPARTLRPAVVSGVALAPVSLFDGKLQLLVPQTFRPMSEDVIRSRFPSGSKPDAMFESADGNVFIVVVLLTDPLIPSKVEAAFPAAKRALAATYPDCPTRIETLAVLDGRTWMRFDLDGDKRAMIAMTSLDGRQLRVETIFLEKPEQKWVDVTRKMWETAVIGDGKR
jgi:hypothetical protein